MYSNSLLYWCDNVISKAVEGLGTICYNSRSWLKTAASNWYLHGLVTEKSDFRIWVHYKFNLMIGSRNSTPLHSRATFVLLRKVVEKLLFRKGSLAWLLVKYAFVFYASFFFLSESGRSRTAAEWRRTVISNL